MRLSPLLAVTALLSFASVPLSAWGDLGHRMVAQAALADLPAELAPWFIGQGPVLTDHASDPDHWKLHDPAERPNHFLDCEYYGGPDGVPGDPAAAEAQVGAEVFGRAGHLPWTIQTRVHTLAEAFRSGDARQVAFEASILSHYVGDLSVPLHTTRNHNGAETGQKGVHAHWESGLLERIVAREGWQPQARPATALAALDQAILAWLKDSFGLVAGVLRDDWSASHGSQARELDPAYWETFLALQGGHVKEQLTAAGQRTAQLILQAWSEAGRPGYGSR
jgi:hypothetical protein